MAKILIADDEVPYLTVFCDGMEAKGHDATAVTSGDQLVTLLRKDRYDIVFLDVVMAGGGATTLTHAVRNIDPDLPIIIITGRPQLLDSPLLRHGLRAAAAKISKTASLEELSALVTRYARPARQTSRTAG